jgi:hypothetical protein
MRGIKNNHNGLWYFLLTNKNNRDNVIIDTRHDMVCNVYHSSILAETNQFLYQCMFYRSSAHYAKQYTMINSSASPR